MTPDMPTVRIQAPASKSASHRAVICAALAQGESRLSGVLDSDDLGRTMGCLTACGARFEQDGDVLAVSGVADGPLGGPLADGSLGGPLADDPVVLDMHESGTTARLMTAVAAAGRGLFEVRGAPRMHERPMGALCKALAEQDVAITYLERPGHMPFVMRTEGLAGGAAAVDAGQSSQYLSGLLLAAPLAHAPMTVSLAGTKVVSWPYVALTLAAMTDFGIEFAVQRLEADGDGQAWRTADWRSARGAASLDVEPGKVRFVVRPGPYRAGNHRVEGDWSNASYFLAAGAIGPCPVTVDGLRPDSLQGDKAMLDILRRMGARVSVSGTSVTVSPPGPGETLSGLSVDMGACPDIVPTVAVLAALAKGETHIYGAAHLRIKESDRIAAPAHELSKVGCRVDVHDDGMVVRPCPMPRGLGVEFSTHNDHRMAMSLSLLELAGVRVALDEPGCVKKSFPDFFRRWQAVRDANGIGEGR